MTALHHTEPLPPQRPAESGPAFARHEITHIDETSGTFELRGLSGCFGEVVVVTGTVRYKEHTMTDVVTGNQDHSSFAFFLNGTAVGQTTGRVWKFREISGAGSTPPTSSPCISARD
jgi:hypothetical protein